MVILENDWFALDGVSCTSVGLSCDTPPVQIMANRTGNLYQVGIDESLYTPDDQYSDITFKFSCFAMHPDSFDTSAVYAFLQNKSTLTMSRNSGYFYKIRKIACTPDQKYDGRRIDYTISIQCAPFKYLVDDEEITITGHGDVYNAGTRYCRPVYEITLSSLTGNGNLTVNGLAVTISMESVSASKIVIDTEKMMAYAPQSGTNMTMHTSGIYRYLNVGVNTVAVTGFCQSVKIKRNQRCY